jgi:hypothetical protein
MMSGWMMKVRRITRKQSQTICTRIKLWAVWSFWVENDTPIHLYSFLCCHSFVS